MEDEQDCKPMENMQVLKLKKTFIVSGGKCNYPSCFLKSKLHREAYLYV